MIAQIATCQPNVFCASLNCSCAAPTEILAAVRRARVSISLAKLRASSRTLLDSAYIFAILSVASFFIT